ncbi:MAG: hypothetical protein IJ660_01060 [Alphaproteobacteria bacterium]|nr:hypothetical protein [Alphaproteobacteria bacterium]
MTEPKIFYYHFKPFNFWLFFNILVLLFILGNCLCCPFLWHWPQTYIMLITILASWGLWIYKHCVQQILAVITDESIKIDHCQPLLWKNVISAEERIVWCGVRKLKIIIFNTREDMDYRYNFLQKHNGGFTPFSIPLYDVVPTSDAEQIKAEIIKRVPLKNLPESSNDK